MDHNSGQDTETVRVIDAIDDAIVETWIDRYAIVDADGVITATNHSWQTLVAQGRNPMLHGAIVGVSLPDHLHRLAAAGNLYARDALIRLLSVVQGTNQYVELDYPPSSPGEPWRYRLSISTLSEPQQGALLRVASVLDEELQRENRGAVLLRAICDHLGMDYACLIEIGDGKSPTLRTLVDWGIDPSWKTPEGPATGPYLEILREGYKVYPQGVSSFFPEDVWLLERSIESCIGAVILGGPGEPVRELTVLGHGEFTANFRAEVLLRSIGQQLSRWLETDTPIAERPENDAAMFRAAFQLCAEPTVIFNAAGKLLELNPAARTLLPEQLWDATGIDLAALAGDEEHPDRMWRELADCGVWSTDKAITDHGGASLPTHVEVRRLDFPGNRAYRATIHDVAALTPAPAELSTTLTVESDLIHQVPDAVFRINSEGLCIYYSPGSLDLLFWKSDPVGHSVQEMVPDWLAVDLDSMISEALSTRQTQFHQFVFDVGGGKRVRDIRIVPATDSEVLLICRDPSTEHTTSLERERLENLRDIEGKAEHLMVRHNPYGLTFRELSVLHLVAEGLGDKEIAKRLGVSIFTVNKHVAKVLEKMGAASRTEAAVRAARENLVL